MDNVIYETEVSVTTILDFFSTIGGLMALLYEFGETFIEMLVWDMYLANFVSLLFMVKSIKPRSAKQPANEDNSVPEHKKPLRRTVNAEESV